MAQCTQLCALYHCFCYPPQGEHDGEGSIDNDALLVFESPVWGPIKNQDLTRPQLIETETEKD